VAAGEAFELGDDAGERGLVACLAPRLLEHSFEASGLAEREAATCAAGRIGGLW
jgi:hypothetical protein